VAIAAIATIGLLAAVSVLVFVLEDRVGVPNASSVFLLAVVVAASRFGTKLAIVSAVGGFLIYDVFFIEPRFTLTVADPGEWLNLVLLLVVGIVVGRLAASQRDRAEAAIEREREAISLFRVSRALATRSSTADVLPELAGILRAETAMDRVRITIATTAGLERTAVDTEVVKAVGDSAAAGPLVPSSAVAWTPPASHHALRRMPGDAPAEWVRVHQVMPGAGQRSIEKTGIGDGSAALPSGAGERRPPARRGRADADAYRVIIEVADRRLGSIWAVRPRGDGPPDGAQTLLLSAAADQIGQALEQDRLGREAREMEIARRSDALKTALLESVSHDLRTPLTSIRAAAGTLLDREVPLDPGAQEATALAIDREAEHLNRLVTNLLDLSRIEAGELRADPEPFELSPLVGRAVDRLHSRLGGRAIEIDVPDDLPPVLVDEVFIDQVLTNLLENTIKYTPSTARIRVRAIRAPGTADTAATAAVSEPGWADSGAPLSPNSEPARVGSPLARETVLLTVEDNGAGVPDEAFGRLFERFYRVRRRGEPSRPGSGIGLTVVRGLVEAMGGRVRASRSSLGGLAIDLTLPSVAPLGGRGEGG
jgi:two-component system sensor histidine kinase KdpD